MIEILPKLTRVTGVCLAVALLDIHAVQSATVTYQFQGITDSGPLLSENYSGSLSFDDSTLTSSYSGELGVSAVQMTFLGTNFTEANAASSPVVSFLNGEFLGLSFSVNNQIIGSNDISFSLIHGSSDTTDAYFTYSVNQPTVVGGAGDLIYSQVNGQPITSIPEPSSVLGLLGLGLVGISLKLK